jgi:hypothetical protein
MDSLITVFDNVSQVSCSHSLRDQLSPLIVAILTAAAAAVVRAIEKNRMKRNK